MAEKKPGLLKRMFSFGFGKKSIEEIEEKVEKATEVVAEVPIETPAATPKTPVVKEAKTPVVEPKPKKQVKPDTPSKAEKNIQSSSKKATNSTAQKTALKAVSSKTKETPAPVKKPTKPKVTKEEANPAPIKKVAKAKLKQKKETINKPTSEPKPAPSKPEVLKTLDIPEVKELPKSPIIKDAVAKDTIVEPEPSAVKTEPSTTAVTLTERKKPAQPDIEPKIAEEKKTGWLSRLTKGLSRSSEALTENITKVFTDKKLDDDTLQDLEDVLLQADLGIETATRIIDALSAQKFGKTVTDQEVREIMADEIEKILSPVARDLDLDLQHQPHVILMIGVNGSGKTTTIGKLSQKLYDAGFSTSLVAGDTFRAAAVEQLKIWGERTQSPVLFRETGADAAALAYDAWSDTRDDRRDVMLMDTAGRLQNRTELMDELEKIVRVLKKQDESAPHTVLLTLDATTGQNALNQVEIFKEVAGVNGIVMTKLDGTARGGILVAIAAKYNLPVYFIGVGEGVDDLEPFEARDFARSIAGLPKEK